MAGATPATPLTLNSLIGIRASSIQRGNTKKQEIFGILLVVLLWLIELGLAQPRPPRKECLRATGVLRPPVPADINSDGSFTIERTSAKKPVVPGDYHVYVVFDRDAKHQNFRSDVPDRYQRVRDDESDLCVTTDDDSKELVAMLKRG